MINGDLEYLMSSLPYLSFKNSEEEQVRVRTLLSKYTESTNTSLAQLIDEEANKFLGRSAVELLSHADLKNMPVLTDTKVTDPVLEGFSVFMAALKNELSIIRASRKEKQDYKQPLRIDNTLSGNPLEKEIQLMRLQWEKLEELETNHYTDMSALVTYKLKLQILERWWSFDVDNGFQQFLSLTKTN